MIVFETRLTDEDNQISCQRGKRIKAKPFNCVLIDIKSRLGYESKDEDEYEMRMTLVRR